MNLILASTSPYRKALLEQLRLPFQTLDSKVDEEKHKQVIKDPYQLTETLAYEKAQSVFQENPQSIVIGSDQVSLFKGEILGKPGTKEKAYEQLMKLQGERHELVTATCVLAPQKKFLWVETVELHMRKLNCDQVKKYIDQDEPLFCAGSYKIESLGISLFTSIKASDHTSIIGLPLLELGKVLTDCGVDPLL